MLYALVFSLQCTKALHISLTLSSSVSVSDNNYKQSSLHYAAEFGDARAAASLIEWSANVGQKDDNGQVLADYLLAWLLLLLQLCTTHTHTQPERLFLSDVPVHTLWCTLSRFPVDPPARTWVSLCLLACYPPPVLPSLTHTPAASLTCIHT